MNDFMSAGLHRVWKDELVATLGPQRGMTHVDLAGGTGDVTFRIVDALQAQHVQEVTWVTLAVESRKSSC